MRVVCHKVRVVTTECARTTQGLANMRSLQVPEQNEWMNRRDSAILFNLLENSELCGDSCRARCQEHTAFRDGGPQFRGAPLHAL